MALELRLVDRARRPWLRAPVRVVDAAGVAVDVMTDGEGRLWADGPLPLELHTAGGVAVLPVAPADGEVLLPGDPPWPRGLAVAFVVALALRFLGVWIFEPTGLVADEKWYHASALRLLDRGPGWLVDLKQNVPITAPPVVPTLYALVAGVFGDIERWLRMCNVLTGALLVFPGYAIGLRVGGPAVGLATAALIAVHPDLVVYGGRLWTEPVYLLISLSAAALILQAPPGAPWRRWVPIGLLLGSAALTRESGLALPGVAMLWAVVGGWRALRTRLPALAVMLVSAAMVIGPWSARLKADPKPDGLVARTSAYNLYLGNVGNRPTYAELADNEVDRAAIATQRAKEAILADMPMWPIHKVERTLPKFLGQKTLSTQVWSLDPKNPFSGKTRLPVLDDAGVRAAAAQSVAWTQLAALVAGAVGWTLSVRRRTPDGAAVLLALVAVAYAPAWLSFAKPRFALPAIPAFLVGAAWLGVRGRAAWTDADPPHRVLAVAAGALVAWVASLEWP